MCFSIVNTDKSLNKSGWTKRVILVSGKETDLLFLYGTQHSKVCIDTTLVFIIHTSLNGRHVNHATKALG